MDKKIGLSFYWNCGVKYGKWPVKFDVSLISVGAV